MCQSGNRPWSCECHRKFLCDKDWHALRVASLALLRPCQGELLVASSPSVAIRIVCDSARFLGVELPSPVVGHLHTIDVGQSRAVFGQRRVGFAERNEGQGQLGPTHCRQGADFSGRPHAWVRKRWQRGVPAHVDEEFRTGVLWPRLHPQTGAPPFPDGRRAVQLHPIIHGDPVRAAGVPRVAPQTCMVPIAPVRVKLPVWPSIRSKWPPPSFGAKGIPLEERRSKCVQRGPGESDNERPCPRFGPTTQSRSRQSLIRGGGRWTPVIPRRSVCDRHHDGVPSAHGRFSAPAMRNHRGAAVAEARVRKERTYPELRFEVGHAWWW